MTVCSTLRNIRVPDLSQATTNLNFGANWNNRISSYETFNWRVDEGMRLYERTNFALNVTSPDGYYVTTWGNGYVAYTGNYWSSSYPGGLNDSISSFKVVVR